MGISEVEKKKLKIRNKKVSRCVCSMKACLSYKVHFQLSYSNLNNISKDFNNNQR